MTEAEIERIGRGFSDLSLPAADFSHFGHWAAVVWLLCRATPSDVARDMPGMIRRFNEAKGGVNSDTEGYHETITQASIAAASALQAGSAEQTLARILSGDLARSDWLLRHWRKETLFGVLARRAWVAPDLEALPFDVLNSVTEKS